MARNALLKSSDHIKKEIQKENWTKRQEISRYIENCFINKFEAKGVSEIDVNLEGKILSLFTNEEIINIKNIFEKKYGENSDNYLEFEEKELELEKGQISEGEWVELVGQCYNWEKEIREKNEDVFGEKYKLKKEDFEIYKLEQDYRNLLRKKFRLKLNKKWFRRNKI